MKNISRILFLCAAILLVGCMKDIHGIDEDYDPSSPVRFVINTTTRGAMIDTVSKMTTMGVFCSYSGTSDWTSTAMLGKMFNQQLNYNSGEWEYPAGHEQYWGADNLTDRYTFFAYAPYGTGTYDASSNNVGNGLTVSGSSASTGVPTLTYTVPVKVENQPDLMVAVPKKNVRPTGAAVALSMQHALTSVAFQIAGNGEKVKAIAVTGVSVSGTLAVDGESVTWTGLGATTTTDFSASLNYDAGQNYYTTTESMSTNLIAGNGYLMMIPQTLTSDAKVVVTYSDDTTKELALGTTTWTAGKLVTYNITLPDDIELDGGENHVLYFTGDAQYPLKVGRWDTSLTDEDTADGIVRLTEADRPKLAFFKFGSVIGFTNGDASGDTWDNSAIKFNPSALSVGTDITGYGSYSTSLPYIPGYTSDDYTGNRLNVSDRSTYHTGTNLLAGKGDPCMLAGMDITRKSEVGYLANYDSGWRLPTLQENYMFVGVAPDSATQSFDVSSGFYQILPADGSGWTESHPGTGVFPKNTARDEDPILPAVGFRYPHGGVYALGITGKYWSSTAYDSSYGHCLMFDDHYTNTRSKSYYSYGYAVRCIKADKSEPEDPTEPEPAPGGGVIASPGVIGYIKGTNTLTLKGSKEYKNNPDIKAYADANFDGLSESTVYVAMFKFGSLVAISSDPTDASEPNLEPEDIVAAPDEWKGSLQGARNYIDSDWGKIPYPQTVTVSSDPANGIGDPCTYYTNYFGAGWKTPTGNPYNGYATSDLTWKEAGVLDTGIPAGALSGKSGESDIFYPATGYRNVSSGALSNVGSTGYYWSGTPCSTAGGYYLYFSAGSVSSSSNASRGYGFAVRCVSDGSTPTPVPTITVSPSTATFVAAGETKQFTVTTTNFTGTPTVTAIDSATSSTATWLTPTLSGSTLTVVASTNTATTSRSATLTLTAGTATTKLIVSQDAYATPAPNGIVIAAPGVIGYIKGTNTLTLKGSNEYKSNPDIKAYADANFGGLSDQTVYTAYFKFWSLVAISGDPADSTTDYNGKYFQSNDIVAAPNEWKGSLQGARNYVGSEWSRIPYSSTKTVVTNPANGYGDPCVYYSNYFGTGWKTPTGRPYNGYSASDLTLYEADDLGTDIPAGALSGKSGENGVFYPTVGARGATTGQLTKGNSFYWSDVPHENDASVGFNLYFSTYSGVNPNHNQPRSNGFAVRCVSSLPTITVSPSTATFAAAGETKTFTVTTTNYSGTPTVSQTDGTSSWLTPTLSGSILTVVATENTATTERTAIIYLAIGTETIRLYVSQDAYVPTVPDGGVIASPGVIGYIKGTNTLTLKGSKEYKSNPDIKAYADANFGGLSDSTVYIAYFKFGSLVAISSDPTDRLSPCLEPEDIIAAPNEWRGSLQGAKNYIGTNWSRIPSYSRLSGTTIGSDPDNGLGDPCMYYFGSGWKLPTGNPYNGYSESDLTWYAADALGTDIPTGALSGRSGETGVFYPAAGYRISTNGSTCEQGAKGNYWSSTVYTRDDIGYSLWSYDPGVALSNINEGANGLSLRCIQVPPTITVSPTTATFAAAGETKTFTVTTTNYSGTPTVTAIDSATSSTASWITPTLSGSTLTVVASANTSTTAARSATITLTAGTATATVTITQVKAPSTTDNTPSDFLGTVGAFWKKNQTGERVITIPTASSSYAGAWTAQVVYYGTGFTAGDILLLAGDSDDATSIAAGTYTNPESRQASAYSGVAQVISGTSTTTSGIKFRVFMGSTWSGSSPRYAKIAVTFGSNYTRLVYIRQGEQDDYLMRPGDPGTGVGGRDLAAKFSPYNITAPEFNGTGSQNQRGASTAARSGVMTDYPSQAGAFYKWAEAAGVVAYNPAVPNSSAVTGWVGQNNVTEYWGNTNEAYESCPTGYRRPQDGSNTNTTAVVLNNINASNSEINQSLFNNPPNGNTNDVTNSVWGYYSDGWFDRFKPGLQTASASAVGVSNTAVSTDKSTVAYVGRLFYNPVESSSNYNASLFFPAPGSRNVTDGSLFRPGGFGYYWSSSATDDKNGVRLYVAMTSTYLSSYTRYYAYPVRCVKDTPRPTITVSPSTATFVADGETKTFTVTTTNFTGTPTVTQTDGTSSWLTPTLSGSTLTLKATVNTSYTSSRSATITLTAGAATTKLLVSQDANVVADGGVIAPPGVIGYIKGTNTLTLRGSKEYSSNTAISNYAKTIDSRGLESETVYVAYFKFGSLVAISSDPTDYQYSTSPYLEYNDIVAYPTEWTPRFGTTINYTSLPGYTSTDKSNGVVSVSDSSYQSPSAAKGDPCMYYFPDGSWKLPAGNPYNGTPNYTTANLTWKTANSLGSNIPAGRLSTRTGEDGIFYPVTGYREDSAGGVVSQDTYGEYWSSTVYDGTGNDGYFMNFNSSSVTMPNHTKYNSGVAVRCISDQPSISVSPDSYIFDRDGGTATFTVTKQNTTATPTITKSGDDRYPSPTWLSVSLSGSTLTVTAASGSAQDARSATITLTVSGVSTTLKIYQRALTRVIVGTVGAFWKKNQTGERVVTIPTQYLSTDSDSFVGDWTAEVVEYGTGFSEGDILLLTGDSDDATSIVNNTYTDPESRQASAYTGLTSSCSGTATIQSGIKFRVFMRSAWNGSAPRYAKILVTFGGAFKYTRYVYLRQGEQADYLMAPGDPGDKITDGRALAIKISPYNLTAPGFLSTGSAKATHSQAVGARNGVMTEYPSQAGAFWKFMEDGVIAYNPAQPTTGGVSGWKITDGLDCWGNTYPDNTNQTYEGCPPGYRRFTNGSTTNTTYVQGTDYLSEIGESVLYNNPIDLHYNWEESDNTVWGYYSDGWFDRFTPDVQESTTSSDDKTAVSTDLSTVAYVGRLFYNPVESSSHYNASLFFPVPGRRDSSRDIYGQYSGNGSLAFPGESGYYLSSSATYNNTSFNYVYSANKTLTIFSHKGTTSATTASLGRYQAGSVRCVLNVPGPAPTLSVGTNPVNVVASESSGNTSVVTTNISSGWSATTSDSWITFTRSSGKSGQSVIFSATANPTSSVRHGYITVSATGATSVTIDVIQAGTPTPTISVSPTTATFAAAGETKTFTVSTTNFSGTPTATAIDSATSSTASWITSATISGSTLTVVAAANTGAERTATVTLTAGTATATVTVTQDSGLDGGHADILYFDTSDGNRLKVGRWDNSTVTVSNMVFTQFGSVIGFILSDTWDNSRSILFNPTSTASYDCGSIPRYNVWNVTTPANSPSVSSTDYHNGTNIQAGRGDICKLVGLTSAQAKAMTTAQLDAYKSGWRLPTLGENRMFIGLEPDDTTSRLNPSEGYYTWTANGGSASSPSTATFPKNKYAPGVTLPIAGYYGVDYSNQHYSTEAYYWTSTPSTQPYGYCIRMVNTQLNPTTHGNSLYGVSVRCMSTGETPTPLPPTISVSPTTATFVAAGETKQFTVTTTNFTGTPTVTQTDGTSSWLTPTLSGSTLTVVATANTATTERTATITLTAGTATAKLIVSQDGIPEPNLAPPGVIGYIKGTNTLTLKGSKEYANATAVDSNRDGIGDIEQYAIDNFGGLSDQTVYIAMFKFGSLIAISSDQTDAIADATGHYIQSDDIIAAPNEWKGSLQGARNYIASDWSKIPVPSVPDTATTVSSDPTNAFGDPCAYYTNYFGSGWKTPTDYPDSGFVYTTSSAKWYAAGDLGRGIPAGRLSRKSGESGMFYTAAGGRNCDSDAPGAIFNAPNKINGYWWNKPYVDSYGNKGYAFAFSKNGIDIVLRYNCNFGFAVRCVRN